MWKVESRFSTGYEAIDRLKAHPGLSSSTCVPPQEPSLLVSATQPFRIELNNIHVQRSARADRHVCTPLSGHTPTHIPFLIFTLTQRQMSADSFQCNGVTKAKQRCKIRVPTDKGYCHYHTAQGPTKMRDLELEALDRDSSKSRTRTSSPSKNPERYQTGYIYVYTLDHLLQEAPKKKDWLLVHHAGKDSIKPFDPKKEILIKVGMTQGSVQKRMKQWEAQCSHKLVSVNPYNLPQPKPVGLSALFRSLKIEKTKKEEIKRDLKYYVSQQNGFYCDKNLYTKEQSVHRYLGSLYGRGEVTCHGCKKDTLQGHGVHIEWFKVPRKDLTDIFTFIDTLASPY